MTTYFLLARRNVPVRLGSRKVFWTLIEGTAAIKESSEAEAVELRKHPLTKSGMIREISREEFDGLKKKAVKLSLPWQRHGPQSLTEPQSPKPQPESVAAAASDLSPVAEPPRKRSKPATAKGALE